MKRAILFLNLGGPETLDDVKPFLYQLFVDPEIIRIPFKPLRMLVAWLISTLREKKSKELYRKIGGGSPIRRLTDEQSDAVEQLLRLDGHPATIRTAFTCSPPFVEDVVKKLYEQGVQKFLAFPLYPQYSLTTTKGALDRTRAAVKRFAPEASLSEICCFPTNSLFLQAHADQIREVHEKFTGENEIHLIFTAHSIPKSLVTKLGDPYEKQMKETVAGVVRELGWTGPVHLAWQSKLGPVEWLSPATKTLLKELGAKGVKSVLLVPIAFVTDHIETLQEIDIEMKEEALESGINEFHRTPGLNTHPLFVRSLFELAENQADFWTDSVTTAPTAIPSK